MTTNTNSNDSQQVSQQLQSERSTLPLLYLPYELAEETSLYFQPMEAARVLSVSRSFYNLFIPRVWRNLQDCYSYGDRDNFEQWLQKYGQYVRLVDPMLLAIRQQETVVDRLPFANRATRLTASLYSNSTLSRINSLIECLQQIKTLRIITLIFEDIPNALSEVELAKMAKAINELELISRIKIVILDYITIHNHDQWIITIKFVELLHPSKRSKLELEMNFNSPVTAQHVRALAPYLVNLDSIDNEKTCLTNGRQYAIDNADSTLMFPRVELIAMSSCCFHPQPHIFKNMTPVRAPRVRTLHLIQQSCTSNNQGRTSMNDNGLIWKPEFSKCAHVVVPSHHWPNLMSLRTGVISGERLMNIIRLNPQLQYLTINPGMGPDEYTVRDREMFSANNFSHDVFKIDKILEQLPRLRTLTIAKLYAAIDADSGSIPLERRRGITVEIGSRMAVTPAAIKYLLQMQQLTELRFYQFAFTDIDETIKLLHDSAGSCGARSFTWHPIEWHQELALAMTAKMPQLAQLSTKGCPRMRRSVFRAKYECSFQALKRDFLDFIMCS